jgi:caa(3)-type oxidase subunit IV
MESPTRTRFPRLVQRESVHHHPGQTEYVQIAVFLAVLTAVEVMVYYPDVSKLLKIVVLVTVAAIKFATVASFFMHLRFDGKLLTLTFCTGMATAAGVFTVAVLTIHAMA